MGVDRIDMSGVNVIPLAGLQGSENSIFALGLSNPTSTLADNAPMLATTAKADFGLPKMGA